MKLSEKEKGRIAELEQNDLIELEDPKRSNYQYKIERLTAKEYLVCKFAVMCLETKYFNAPADVVEHIEDQHVY